ncbi:MAG: hypothetical protein ACLGG0_15725 [Bacteriovoracia bacterium]
MKTSIDKIRILTKQNFKEDTPLVSIFVPLRGNEIPLNTMFNSLVRAANKIIQRDGFKQVQLKIPDWRFWITEGAVSLAIYHAEGVTTIIPLNINMPPRMIVANSFHVKPVLASSSNIGEALLMTFHNRGCSLTRVTATGSMLHETYIPSRYDLNNKWLEQLSRAHLRDFIEHMKAEVESIQNKQTRFLIIDGASEELIQRADVWTKLRIPVRILERTVTSQSTDEGVKEAQKMLFQFEKDRIRKSVNEAISTNRIIHSEDKIDDVAKLILQRKVKKIFLSLEDLEFGELDAKSGAVKFHKAQKNTRDDDVLDDLAELALKNSVEVNVVSRDYLPNAKKLLIA